VSDGASFSSRVYRAVAWSAGLRIVSQIVTWAITLVLVRLLTPADYGLMAAAGFYFGLLVIVRELGLPSVIIQQRLEGEALARVFGAVLAAHWLLFVLVLAAAPWLADLAGQPQLVELLRVLALPLLIMGFGTIGRALLQRALDFRRIAIVELLSAVLSAVVALGCALAGLGVWALAAGLVAQHALNTILFLLWSPDRVRPRFDLVKLLPQLRFGSMIFLSSISATCSGTLPAFAVGRFFGATSAGLWALASDLADLLASRVMPIVTAVAFPAIAEVQSESERVRSYFVRGGALIAFFTFPILFGLAATSSEIVPLILGAQWVGAAVICSLICFRSAFWTVAALMSPLLVGLGRPELMLQNSLWRLGLTLVAAVAGLSIGVEAFAAGLIVVEIIVVLMNLKIAAPLLRTTWWRMTTHFLPPLCNAGVMAACVFYVGEIAPDDWSPLATLLSKVSIGVFVYGALAAITDRGSFAAALAIVRRAAGGDAESEPVTVSEPRA
jgi:O-antigen/teichoic acid export membrane protein